MKVVGANAGIKGFRTWFSSEFPLAMRRIGNRNEDSFDHVCIDMNQVLHQVLRRSATKKVALHQAKAEVRRILKRCSPQQSVCLACDGSAPLAKLMVQRQRRGSSGTKRYQSSALNLTPGTKFMEEVASTMKDLATEMVKIRRFRKVKFFISGANMPGEGELKCLDWVRTNCAAGTEESVVIVGNDSDLLVQALGLPKVKNMFVCTQIGKASFEIWSMWVVVRTLEKIFPGQSEFVRADLILLAFLGENDYLPRMKLVSFKVSFDTYTELKKTKYRDEFLLDGDDRTFNWPFFKDLMAVMKKPYTPDKEFAMAMTEKYPNVKSYFSKAASQGKLGEDVEADVSPCFEDKDEESSAIPKMYQLSFFVQGRNVSWVQNAENEKAAMAAGAKIILKKFLPETCQEFLEGEKARALEEESFRNRAEGDDRDSYGNSWQGESKLDVEAYLSTLLWNVQMYADGYAPNFYWKYSRRGRLSCSDVHYWLEKNPEAALKIRSPVSKVPPLPAAIMCMCMMPTTAEGLSMVPGRLQPLLNPGSPFREVLDRYSGSDLDIPAVLRALQQVAPEEILNILDDSHKRTEWTVVYSKPTSPETPMPPVSTKILTSPEKELDEDAWPIYSDVMAATTFPPCLPWSQPCVSYQPKYVEDEPFKVGFTRQAKVWRKRPQNLVKSGNKISAPEVQQGGWGRKGAEIERGVGGRTVNAAPSVPRIAPVIPKGRKLESPPVARHITAGSMCFGGAVCRLHCRLRL